MSQAIYKLSLLLDICGRSSSEVAQSCPTLCDPMDYSPPGSSIHGIFQAGVLEWVAISFSRGSARPRDRTCPARIAGQTLYHLSHQGIPVDHEHGNKLFVALSIKRQSLFPHVMALVWSCDLLYQIKCDRSDIV